ncbi:MAG: ATP-binding cassette domain-containing protein [Bacteroidota bacterium]
MAIEVQNIYKSFGPNEVLKGLSFTFEPGKINMIIGASGSGKSVMLKCIVGLMIPDGGEVIFDGINFHEAEFKDVKEIRQNIGMLFQGSALFDYLNVEENVAFPIKMFTRQKSSEIRDRVNFCLDRVNLQGKNKLYPSELSGGMQKRVGIARAIAMNPKFLFVDEPNSGLDPLTASVIDKLIQELTLEFNMTTVVVSHDMNSVMNIGDKIMFLYKGKKEWEGTNKEILHSDSEALNEFVFVSDLIKK